MKHQISKDFKIFFDHEMPDASRDLRDKIWRRILIGKETRIKEDFEKWKINNETD